MKLPIGQQLLLKGPVPGSYPRDGGMRLTNPNEEAVVTRTDPAQARCHDGLLINLAPGDIAAAF